jgi:uncharacterized protein YhaN
MVPRLKKEKAYGASEEGEHAMRMQEPEQWQQARQEGQEGSDLGAAYSGRYDPKAQQEYIEVVAGDDHQEQKIYPQEQVSSRRNARSTIAIVLSSIGFFLALAGIILSAIALQFANGKQAMLQAGAIGLVSSIVVMLACIAIFVIAVISLVMRLRRERGWTRRTFGRIR